MPTYESEAIVCPPDYFFTEFKPEDQINPWMVPGIRVDHARLQVEWETLVEEMRAIGIDVHEIEPQPGLPDLVFATDSALVVGDTAVMARFRYAQRQGEANVYRKWFEANNYRIIDLPDDNEHYFEGGDAQFYNGTLLLGTSFRSTKPAGEFIGNKLNKSVQPLELVNDQFYHLDTALMVVGSTAFFHPPAFSEGSKSALTLLVPRSELVVLDPEEANRFAANSLVFGKHVIMQQGNPKLEAELAKRGYYPHAIDLSELHKSGGGAHCAVQKHEANSELPSLAISRTSLSRES